MVKIAKYTYVFIEIVFLMVTFYLILILNTLYEFVNFILMISTPLQKIFKFLIIYFFYKFKCFDRRLRLKNTLIKEFYFFPKFIIPFCFFSIQVWVFSKIIIIPVLFKYFLFLFLLLFYNFNFILKTIWIIILISTFKQ